MEKLFSKIKLNIDSLERLIQIMFNMRSQCVMSERDLKKIQEKNLRPVNKSPSNIFYV